MPLTPSRGLLSGGGAVVGLLSGLVGSAGPLGAAIFLTLNLPPVAYIASEAVTAIGMHTVKSVIYGSTINLGATFWPLALAMGGTMVLGTWASKRVIERIPAKRFPQFVSVLLIAIAVQMIITG
ncbi:TSUP family transporter [Microvirga zambiensis]|uniref:TSUP family transporter n=1 Tax=Microvirga zambiensis TaxID=1402137 RepID=UPI00191E0844|nr:TSUP family transporter [Microvirga zambiensis]